MVYPQTQATKFLSNSKAARDVLVAEISPKYRQAEAELTTAESAYERAQRSVKYQERMKETGQTQSDDEWKKALQAALAGLAKVTATAQEVLRVKRQYNDAASPARYFDGLPASLRTVKTDIDGKFSLRVPNGKYILMASSKRRVPVGDIEDYYWILKIDTAKGASPIVLSNDNLVETNCKECALVHKED
jgi:DNA repair exonuclease SbcCD ATPase subunit